MYSKCCNFSQCVYFIAECHFFSILPTHRIFKSINNPVDIGLKPASGLKSPRVKILQEEKLEEEVACVRSSLLTSQQLAEMESKTSAREVS